MTDIKFNEIVRAHDAANERGSVNAMVAHKHRGELIELGREMKPYLKICLDNFDEINIALAINNKDLMIKRKMQALLDRLEKDNP